MSDVKSQRNWELHDATANRITDTDSGVFERVGLTTNMLFGFCADTCNSMFGANHSVSTILRQRHSHLEM